MDILQNSEAEEEKFTRITFLFLIQVMIMWRNIEWTCNSKNESVGSRGQGGVHLHLNKLIGNLLVWSMRHGVGTLWHQLWLNEDDEGPVNIPGQITEEATSIDFFLSLFVKDDFWQNLTEKTNLLAHQMYVEKPNYWYLKNFKNSSVNKMKAFIGLRIYKGVILYKVKLLGWLVKQETWLSCTWLVSRIWTKIKQTQRLNVGFRSKVGLFSTMSPSFT